MVRLFPFAPFVLALAVAAPAAGTAELTAVQCDADRDQLLAEIAKNRADAVRYYDDAIAEAALQDTRDQLAEQRARVWEDEEQQRAMAALMWRDCMAHVNKLKAAKPQ